MTKIQAPELGLRLAKFLKAYGPVQLGDVEQVVFPTITVGDISEEQTRARLYAAFFVQTANAANGTRIRLVNPPASKVLIRPSNFRLAVSATSYWVAQLETFSGAVGFNGIAIGDQVLIAAGGISVGGFVGDTPAGVAALTGLYHMGNASVTAQLDANIPGLVIPPGFAIAWYSSIINVEGRMSAIWSEDPIA